MTEETLAEANRLYSEMTKIREQLEDIDRVSNGPQTGRKHRLLLGRHWQEFEGNEAVGMFNQQKNKLANELRRLEREFERL